MRKIALSILVSLSICSFASCGVNESEKFVASASETYETCYENNDVEVTDFSPTQCETTTYRDNEQSCDISVLSNLGVYQLAEQDIIWNTFFASGYNFKLDYMPQTAKIDGETYVELSVATRDDIINQIDNIQNALNVTLELSDDKSFYLCPFDSIQELKKHMLKTYTESYIDNRLSYIPVIEYNGSLYISDSGSAYPAREAISASIIENNDTNILFSIEYNLIPIEGENLTVNYSAVYENGKWLLDTIE